MINYPELKFSTNFERLEHYLKTGMVRERLKLVVYIPESIFDEYETYECGFLLLPKDIELKTNDYIYLSIIFDDEYDDEFLEIGGMGCLAFVSECFSLNGINFSNMQIVSVGFSNRL